MALTATIAIAASAIAQSNRKDREPEKGSAASPFAATVRQSSDEILLKLQKDGDFEAGAAAMLSVFDQTVAFGDPSDTALFRDSALNVRLVNLVVATEPSTRAGLLVFLLQNPDVARAMAFTVRPDQEKAAEVMAVLSALRTVGEKSVVSHANLTAAMCVVHDQKLTRRINENGATAADPVPLFNYFIANERSMFFGLKNVPPELLIYVVDSTASIDEMQWALGKYAGNRNVGGLFFDIKYDYDHFADGDPKKVTVAGWNLPNILRIGGVCADQAYFAVSVGKSIGVPTAYVSARSSEVGHAWVGFLQSDAKSAWWNFNSGRYEAYRGVRGNMQDPQTRQTVPDSTVALLAGVAFVPELDRQYAAAMSDAAKRLIEPTDSKKPFKPQAPQGIEVGQAREASTAEALKLLEAGLTVCPAQADGWRVVEKLADDKMLSLDDKRKWEGVLYRLCGEKYPDFYLDILEPMIATVADVNEQNALWNGAFKRFTSRPDLAASVRMSQADMWLKAGKIEKAGQCYEDVINRYANAGPFVVNALGSAEQILRKAKDGRRILMLYERAWAQIEKPRDMAAEFARQSNYYRVGKLYAQRLQEAGMPNDAANVRTAIGDTKSAK